MCTTVDGTIPRGWRRTAYAKLSHSVNQRRPFHSQPHCGTIPTTHYPIAGFKRAEDVISLHLVESCHRDICVLVSAEWLQLGGWGAQNRVRGENHRSLDKV